MTLKNVTSGMSRRSFLKSMAAGTAAAGLGASSLSGCSFQEAEEVAEVVEEVLWNGCVGNLGCGHSLCPLRFHVKDGQISYVECDNTGGKEFGENQFRSCLRGRSARRWINSPDRLKYPMKRTGKRGEGTFERISWDEAIDLMVEKINYTIDTYGNEAIYSNYTGTEENDRPLERLLHTIGGRLDFYGMDSCAAIMAGMSVMYGFFPPFADFGFAPVDASEGYGAGTYDGGSVLGEAVKSDILFLFGFNPCETRMSGGSGTYDLAKVRAAGTKIVNIDYRLNETSAGFPEEWVPIRPGADAALASAMAYVLIDEGLVDEGFLHTHCVGYDEETMPDSAKGQGKSYKDYIMGTGYDRVPKTPEWAQPITLIPAERITGLAHELASAKSAFVAQGWSLQRASNGENACRAVAMLAVITGQIGKPGTSTGAHPIPYFSPWLVIPGGENPVKTEISCLGRIDAIDHGERMTAERDGVRGKDKLDTGIKLMFNHCSNALFNQHGDLNHTHEVLVDESKCEFIVVWDVAMTPTARYADLLLPDAMREEDVWISGTGSAGSTDGVFFGKKIQDPPYECRNTYDVCVELAKRLGVEEAYTEGRTWKEWNEHVYEAAIAERGDADAWPSVEEGYEMGFFSVANETQPAFAPFVEDPDRYPLGTPSGKIEIYSEAMVELAKRWVIEDERDILSPIPIYNPGIESYEDATDEYPLQLAGWHPKSRYHSSWEVVEEVQQVNRHQMWINPLDAEKRGISNGDRCRAFNARGEIEIEARVTPRIVPGVIGCAEGTWHNADMDGDRVDKGGNINVLTKNSPQTPLAKGNPSNSNICQIEKL